MNHQVQPRDAAKRRKRFRNFFLGVLARRLEGRDVAVAESGPRRRFRLQHAPVKIQEAESPAEFANIVVRFVISRQHPKLFAQRFQRLAAFLKALAERRQIARADVHIRRLPHDPRQRAHIAVNVAEDQDFHEGLIGAWDTGLLICGMSRRIRLCSMPFVSQPSSASLPSASKITS